MAKRRTSKQDTSGCLPVLILAGIIFAAAVIVTAVKEAEQHPLAGGAVVFLIAVGAGLSGLHWWKRREQQQLYAQQQYEIQIARSQEIAPYHQMGPKDFERALAFLCERDGCTQVQVVGGAGDLGADVKAIAPDGRLIVLQAKRYGPTAKVTGPDLQKFGGTCFNVHGAHVAAVVTTASFTKQAREYAQHMGIGLFDEHALAAWASRTGPAPWH